MGLCWIDSFRATYMYMYKYLLMSNLLYILTSEVTTYLSLLCHRPLVGVDCGVELRIHVVTRPRVGRE